VDQLISAEPWYKTREINFPLNIGRSYGDIIFGGYRRVLSVALFWVTESPETELLSCSMCGTVGENSKRILLTVTLHVYCCLQMMVWSLLLYRRSEAATVPGVSA